MGSSSSKIICSALIVRHTLLRVARGSVDARALPTTTQCAQLLTLWLFPWRHGNTLARCVFLFWLQHAGRFFPELAIFTFIAGNLSGFFQRRLGRWAALLPPFISGSITFFMHEAPWLVRGVGVAGNWRGMMSCLSTLFFQMPCACRCFALALRDSQISSSYLTLLRGVSGASRPVLDWENSPLHTSDPAATTSARAEVGTCQLISAVTTPCFLGNVFHSQSFPQTPVTRW